MSKAADSISIITVNIASMVHQPAQRTYDKNDCTSTQSLWMFACSSHERRLCISTLPTLFTSVSGCAQ